MNQKNTPITNLSLIYSLSSYITFPLAKNIYFKVAKISYELFEDESFQYIIEPYYDILDAFGDVINIPGINITLRREKYYRVNIIPIFVSDRTFPKSRVEARKLLSEKNLSYYNPLLWLTDSVYTYTGDKLLLKSEAFFEEQKAIENSKNIYRHILYTLQNIGRRRDFALGKLALNVSNREDILKIYLYQYSLVQSTYYKQIAKSAGRHKIEVSSIVMKEVVSLYDNKIISVKEAMKRLSLNSESTFYRRLKEYRNKNQ